MPLSAELPIVSVIIPCFNQGHYVDEAVDSVLQQSFRQFEIIIVNDGSSDPETNELLAGYRRPQTTVITTTNQGLAAARNNGIRQARGRYILPLDADDRIGPDYMQQAVACLESQLEVGIVYARARLFGAVEGEWHLPDYSLENMLLDNVIFCSGFFRHSDWQKIGGYDESLKYGWEDYDFWLSLIEMGRKVHRLPEVHFYYRVAADSMVRARPKQHKVETFSALFKKHQALHVGHIDVWIDALLDRREPYYEARLQWQKEQEELVRKVGPGHCQLEFVLTKGSGSLTFRPAHGPVILRLLSALVRKGDEAGEQVALQSNADLVLGQELFFLTQPPAMHCSLPEHLGEGRRLILELEYLAFGQDCLPRVVVAYQCLLDSSGQTALVTCPVASSPSFLRGVWRQLEPRVRHYTQRILKRLQLTAIYWQVKRSRVFDPHYYRLAYPDVAAGGRDPLWHFLETGWQEGRNPNGLFDTRWYQKQYLAENDPGNPLLHYLQEGAALGYRPGPLFFPDFYRGQVEGAWGKQLTPLAHYLVHWREGVFPNPLYREPLPETSIEGAQLDPLTSYVVHGPLASLNPFPLFDQEYYSRRNADFVRNLKLPLVHYLDYGGNGGRRPNALFDPDYYRRVYLDNKTSPLAAFFHYAQKGLDQDHRPNALFDPGYYRQRYMRNDSRNIPLQHYLQTGLRERAEPCPEIAALQHKPVISLLIPVYNTNANLLERCLQSVYYQAYPYWQLCLVDDGSPAEHIRPLLEQWAAKDPRIEVNFLARNLGISAATNAAAEMAEGDYVALLDHDDELAAEALFAVVQTINEQDPDVLYSDEDLINSDSKTLDTFYKPQFNPELLLNHNYITHFLVTRKELFLRCGGCNSRYDGAQDYDLILKLVEESGNVVQIPRVLYHWRAHERSTSINHQEKNYADEAGRLALQAALDRRGVMAEAYLTDLRYFYRVMRKIKGTSLVTVIVDPGLAVEQLAAFSERLVGQWPELELLSTVSGQGKARKLGKLRLIKSEPDESPAAFRNRAVREAKGRYLCFLGNQIRPESEGWLKTLIEYATDSRTGLIGGCVHRQEHPELQKGSLPDLHQQSWRYFASFLRDVTVQHNGIHCPQNTMAVDAHLCLLEKTHFLAMEGYEERYMTLEYAHLDLCYRLHEQGLHQVFTPYAVAEANSTGDETEHDLGMQDKLVFQRRWYALLVAGNPFYNANLLADNGISLASFQAWLTGRDTSTP